jgi:AcrR family transcriptional regulator
VRTETKPSATKRILGAARALVERGGAAEVSMGDVASAAGVSKALVHYHFRDKESLMQALVDDVGLAVVTRARDAVPADAADHALDSYWSWLQRELRAGDLRILMSLAEYDSPRVRAAARRIADQRREVTAEQVTALFTRLGLVPRVPPALLAETVVAFIDGLAASVALDAERDPRPAFDVLWLALLTLAE